MIPFARERAILFLLSLLIFFYAVRSENDKSGIKLPSDAINSDRDEVDLCAGSKPSSCPVKCFRTDPVCGVDGVTYWCGCGDAMCSGTKVAKLGFCEVGNGSSAPISGQALLLVHILWLIVLGVSVLFGLF